MSAEASDGTSKDSRARLNGSEIKQRLATLKPEWTCENDLSLERKFSFPDFVTALQFVNQAGEICEAHNHHADFKLSWGAVVVSITTHDAGGLTGLDFALAAEIDGI